jgi:hypothetical protein
MSKSTPKIEKIFEEIQAQCKIDEGKSDEQLIREKIDFMKKQFISMRKMMIFLSNIYLVLLVFSIFLIYVMVVQGAYFIAVLDCIWFVMLLRNLLDTYVTIRIYSGDMKIQSVSLGDKDGNKQTSTENK